MKTTSEEKRTHDEPSCASTAPPGRHGESAWLFFPHPVIITDRENRILSANPAARKLVGPESGGNLWSRLGPIQGAPQETQLATPEGLIPWSGIILVAGEGREDGVRRLHVIMRPIAETGGGDAARLWILKEREDDHAETRDRERQLLRERAEMAAEIAHDLNNYLAVLTGNIELLPMFLGDNVPEKVQRCLTNLHTTLGQIESFTDSCLRLRCPREDDGTLDVNRFLTDQIAFQRPQRPFRKIMVVTQLCDALPRLRCDPADLRHVFYHVMCNAAEALNGASADNYRITVRTEHILAVAGEAVRILVADDGPGIPLEIRDQIFREPVTTKVGHAGFGLLTVADIVRKMGGTVVADDPPTGGTVVTLTLPV